MTPHDMAINQNAPIPQAVGVGRAVGQEVEDGVAAPQLLGCLVVCASRRLFVVKLAQVAVLPMHLDACKPFATVPGPADACPTGTCAKDDGDQ